MAACEGLTSSYHEGSPSFPGARFFECALLLGFLTDFLPSMAVTLPSTDASSADFKSLLDSGVGSDIAFSDSASCRAHVHEEELC